MPLTSHSLVRPRVYAGLDVGGSKILGAIVDQQGQVLIVHRWVTGVGSNEAVWASVSKAVEFLTSHCRRQGRRLAGIGVGAPGYISASGTIVEATNLGVADLPLQSLLEAAYGLPVRVRHDVAAAALGESRYGAGVQARCQAYIGLGTGIGAGFVFNGVPFEGAGGRAGEFGHVCLEPDGPLCGCGRQGCLEALAAGPAITRHAREIARDRLTLFASRTVKAGHRLTPEVVAQAALNGDAPALEVLHRAAGYIGQALAGLINVLDLDLVILGGGLAQMGAIFLDPIRSATYHRALPACAERTRIVPAGLGTLSVAVGAVTPLLANGVPQKG